MHSAFSLELPSAIHDSPNHVGNPRPIHTSLFKLRTAMYQQSGAPIKQSNALQPCRAVHNTVQHLVYALQVWTAHVHTKRLLFAAIAQQRNGEVQMADDECGNALACLQVQKPLPLYALPFPGLPGPALLCPALPCPALPCPAFLLPCPLLPCPALPFLALPSPPLPLYVMVPSLLRSMAQ